MTTRKDESGATWSDDSGSWKQVARTDSEGNDWVQNIDTSWTRATPLQSKLMAAGQNPVQSSKYQSGYSTVDLGKRTQEDIDKAKAFDRERVLEMRGPAAQQRAAEAESMPFYQKVLPIIGDEFKSLYHGSKDVAAMTRTANDLLAQQYPGVFPGERTDMERLADRTDTKLRQQGRAQERELFKELDESTTIGQLARMAPYLATGRLISSPVEKAVGAGLDKYKKLRYGNQTMGINATGRKPIVPELIGDLTAGAVEGAMHEDETPFEGMMSSVIGSAVGKTQAGRLEKAAIDDSLYDTSLVERFIKDKGYVASPGMRTGNVNMQEIDSKQSKRPSLKNWYKVKDANNRKVLLNEILEASGLARIGVAELEGIKPSQMDSVLKSMGKEFDELEATSNGIIPAASVQSLIAQANELIPSLPVNLANKLKQNLKIMAKGDTEMDVTFSGKDFKGNMSRIKNAKTDAMKVDSDLAALYDNMADVYKTGLETGMGGVKAEAWRDVNERWALTKLIQEKALDVNGVFSGQKLLRDLEVNDIDRITAGRGGERIKRFHDVAKMVDIENKQSHVDFGEGLSGLSSKEKRLQEELGPGWIKTPSVGDTDPVTGFLLNRQYGGYIGGPIMMEGLLGAPRDSVSRFTRAMEQGTDSRMGLLNFMMTDEEKETFKKEAEERVARGGRYFGVE
jgi:hypothetical protein